MLVHISALEDAAIALSDREDESVDHRKAQKVAKQIKRKRQQRNQQTAEDSNTSEENEPRRRSPRFKQGNTSSKIKFFSHGPKAFEENRNVDQEMKERDNSNNESENQKKHNR